MAKTRISKRKSPTDVPRLSPVEWAAVLVFLEWQVALSTNELETWRRAAKLTHNAQTVASVTYHRDALSAFQRALAWSENYVPQATQAGVLPPPTSSIADLIARN